MHGKRWGIREAAETDNTPYTWLQAGILQKKPRLVHVNTGEQIFGLTDLMGRNQTVS